MTPALALALVVASGPAPSSPALPCPAAVVVGGTAGALAGFTAGVGVSFAVVYGTNNNGCYFGGCDAPLLGAIAMSVIVGTAGGVAGGVVGSVVAWNVCDDCGGR